jgi:methylglutaconyl-CoA hydratase
MKYIQIDVQKKIASITLNRPEKHNALNPEFVTELIDAFTTICNNEQIRVVILKSSGENFSAGADLAYLQQLQQNTYSENLEDSNRLKLLFSTIIYQFEKIVIAQVEGKAIAGGCGLVSACDIVFAVPEAVFGYTEVKIGFVPALVAGLLLKKIGEGRGRQLLLSGELIDANIAFQYGLVNFIENKVNINSAVYAYAEKLALCTSSQSIKATKDLLSKLQGQSFAEGMSYAAEVNAKARLTDDYKKGLAAFLDKKNPKW